jgi:glycosyltransferase involved in cell wall biosynthesis
MHIVYSKRQDVCFFIIGDGPLKDLVVEKLRPYILCGRVTLLPWVANVEKYISTVKLLVIPSKIEGEPQIMIEAMSCGTPVLATPVGAIPSIIKDGVNGFLLKSDDHKHIADTILELLDKQDLLEKVSVNAYNYIKENFSYEKTLEAWRKILHELELE